MKFIKATCPGCGASLELADHLQSANCEYCNQRILIIRDQRPAPPKPPTLPDNLKLAKKYLESGSIADAGKQISAVLEKNSEDAAAWALSLKLVNEYIYANKFEDADVFVSKALERDPEDRELWLMKWLCSHFTIHRHVPWKNRWAYRMPSEDGVTSKYFENSGYSKLDIPNIYMRHLTGSQIIGFVDWENGSDLDKQFWDAAQKAEREPITHTWLIRIAGSQLNLHFHKYIDRKDRAAKADYSFHRQSILRERIKPFRRTFAFELLT